MPPLPGNFKWEFEIVIGPVLNFWTFGLFLKCPIDTRINESLANVVGFSSALNDLAFAKYFTDQQTKFASSSDKE